MTRDVHLYFAPGIYDAAISHLFPGDDAEHAGVLLCGWDQTESRLLLSARQFVPAKDGLDYVRTEEFHGRLQPLFIDEQLTQAAQRRLAYVAVHNHGSDDRVQFSPVDLRSHEYGYPTLAKLNRGLPVGAAVFGRRSVEVDIWMPDGSRHQLSTARVVGRAIRHLWASPGHAPKTRNEEEFDRQLPFLRQGQGLIRSCVVAIVGLGGVGSQLLEPLVRMGLRRFVLIDPDRIDTSNYSRLHGALPSDLPAAGQPGRLKVEIAHRLLKQIAPDVEVKTVPSDVSHGEVHRHLLGSDFIFLAADTAAARLTCNAVAQQYLLPMLQLGTKIQVQATERRSRAFGAVRHIRPGRGCLWCNGLIDRVELANASKPQELLERERYGVNLPNPAVVTFNAEVAARGMNEFLMRYAAPAAPEPAHDYTLIDLMSGERELVEARTEPLCPFCAIDYDESCAGLGNAQQIPTMSSSHS